MYVSLTVTTTRTVQLDSQEFADLLLKYRVSSTGGQSIADRIEDAIGVHGEFTAALVKMSDIDDEEIELYEIVDDDDEDEETGDLSAFASDSRVSARQ